MFNIIPKCFKKKKKFFFLISKLPSEYNYISFVHGYENQMCEIHTLFPTCNNIF